MTSEKLSSFKKLLLLIAFSLCLIPIFAFGGKASDSKMSVVGHVKFYGNVPFEFPGFETVDGYIYTIQIEENAKFTLDDIKKENGYLIELTGEVDKSKNNGLNVLKDGIFVVSEWKKL